jgi:hypothetical protein
MIEVLIHPMWEITPYGKRRGFTFEMLGEIPLFLQTFDKRPAREQIDAAYQHGGGWQPTAAGNFTVQFDEAGRPILLSSGDPPYLPLAETRVGNERVFYYVCSFVAISQPDGAVEVSRCD